MTDRVKPAGSGDEDDADFPAEPATGAALVSPVPRVIRPALATNPRGRAATSAEAEEMPSTSVPVLPLPGQGPKAPRRETSLAPSSTAVPATEPRNSGPLTAAPPLPGQNPAPAVSAAVAPVTASGRIPAVLLDPPVAPSSEIGRLRAVALDPKPEPLDPRPDAVASKRAERLREKQQPQGQPPRPIVSIAAVVVVAIVVIVLSSRATKGSGSRVYTAGDKVALGELWLRHPKGVTAWGGVVVDKSLLAAVDGIGKQVANVVGRPARFVVVNEPVVAVAMPLPDGTVVVSVGMLRRLKTEAQLAAVLAHALAHLDTGDVDRRLDGPAPPASVVRAGLTGANPDVAVELVSAAGTQVYDVPHENAADTVTLDVLVRAGFDPQGWWLALRQLSGREGASRSGYLVQHPDGPERMTRLQAAEGGGRGGDDAYRRSVLDRIGRVDPTTTKETSVNDADLRKYLSTHGLSAPKTAPTAPAP